MLSAEIAYTEEATKETCSENALSKEAPAQTVIASSPKCPIDPPADIKELTIKNLDTGEEYIIGENDPDFEFDTFELTGGEIQLLLYIYFCIYLSMFCRTSRYWCCSRRIWCTHFWLVV